MWLVSLARAVVIEYSSGTNVFDGRGRIVFITKNRKRRTAYRITFSRRAPYVIGLLTENIESLLLEYFNDRTVK